MIFRKVKDKLINIFLMQDDICEELTPKDIHMKKELEYLNLLKLYNTKSKEIDLVCSESENFDALCCELKSINYRIKNLKQELLNSQK